METISNDNATSLSTCTSNLNIDINKIASDAISKLVQDTVTRIYTNLCAKVKDHRNKSKIELGCAYEEYLFHAFERFSKTKTLLYRNEPVYLYDFFECVNFQYLNEEISTCDIRNILRIGHQIILSGTGGIGKTTLMKHLFLNSIENTTFIPIFIELRSLNSYKGELIDYIYENLKSFGFTIDKQYFEYSLEIGCYVFLFDGYDEVMESMMETVCRSIHQLSDKYNDNYFIISSRPCQDFIGWDNFHELSVCTLKKEQAMSLINKIQYDDSIKSRFVNDLNRELYAKHESFASNPLLLTIMLLTYAEHSTIPDQLKDFYEQAFLTLFSSHDSRKRNYVREIRSKLDYSTFKKVFSDFCFHTYFERKYEFSEADLFNYLAKTKEKTGLDFVVDNYYYDLINLVCMLVRDGIFLRFSHRSFQEYFAAVYTESLTDNVQIKLFNSISEDFTFYSHREFLNLLYSLQDNRFNKNIVYPMLKKLKDLYTKHALSKEWLFSFCYDAACIHENDNDNNEEYLGYRVKQSAYSYIIHHVWSNCNIKSSHEESLYEKDNKAIKDVIAYITDTGKDEISFSKAKEVGIFGEIVKSASWFFKMFDFAMEYLEKYEQQKEIPTTGLADFVSSI